MILRRFMMNLIEDSIIDTVMSEPDIPEEGMKDRALKLIKRKGLVICIGLMYLSGILLAWDLGFFIMSTIGLAIMLFIACVTVRTGIKRGILAATSISFILYLAIIMVKLLSNTSLLDAFDNKAGAAAYIYQQMSVIMQNSSLLGNTMSKTEIIERLPEADRSLVFVNYSSQYGLAISTAMIFLILLVSVLVVYYTYKNNKSNLVYAVIPAGLIIILTVTNLMVCFQIIPFVARSMFLPFLSSGVGVLMSYVLLGIAVENCI